ncbi:T3SS effector NleG family protein, partial [Shigella sonnei]|nr:T3SS effector NleG family protein [Shigella sonnei]
MPVDLTPYILPGVSFLSDIPQETLSEIRNQTIRGEAQVRLGELMVSIRPMQVNGYFMGSLNQDGLSNDNIQIGLQYIEHIERTLNHGSLTSREVTVLREIEMLENMELLSNYQLEELLDKIEVCAFNVEHAQLQVPESLRTCPVTLCEPEDGVFMRNSMNSNVCMLYDKMSLIYLVKTRAAHPLSRESIAVSMIVGRDNCAFDSDRGNFVL